MNAICHRCGSIKAGAFLSCSDCDYAPRGTDRTVAWLFSSSHLNEEELKLAANRVRGGELPEPSVALRSHARARMGRPKAAEHTDTPLESLEMVAIALANLLLTPLAGFALWWGLKPSRPTAAHQILRVTVPICALLGLGWSALVINRLFG
jgi:hypothetical protein